MVYGIAKEKMIGLLLICPSMINKLGVIIAEPDSSSAGRQHADMEFTRVLFMIIKCGSVRTRHMNNFLEPKLSEILHGLGTMRCVDTCMGSLP